MLFAFSNTAELASKTIGSRHRLQCLSRHNPRKSLGGHRPPCSKRTDLEALEIRNRLLAPLAPVPAGDAAETGGRSVSGPHPTRLSQAVCRLALLPFPPAPIFQTFWQMVLITERERMR